MTLPNPSGTISRTKSKFSDGPGRRSEKEVANHPRPRGSLPRSLYPPSKYRKSDTISRGTVLNEKFWAKKSEFLVFTVMRFETFHLTSENPARVQYLN